MKLTLVERAFNYPQFVIYFVTFKPFVSVFINKIIESSYIGKLTAFFDFAVENITVSLSRAI